jgi:DNA primase
MSAFEILREQVMLERLLSVNGSGKACCVSPSHQDSNPSIHLYDDHVHCFSCGFHGDVVDVWAAMRGFGRPIEAALDLAREFDVQLPELDPEARRRLQERRDKEDLYLAQARACHWALEKHPRVCEWWTRRGFGPDLQSRFLLGANKDGTEAVIPFWHRGRVEGLIRRKLEGEPKYILPTVEEFPHGHRPLFIPATLKGEIFLVEGYIDALAVAATGRSAIAIGGTDVSDGQNAELGRVVSEDTSICILPDNDAAGAEAARR